MEQLEIFGILLARPEKPLVFLTQFAISLFVFGIIVRRLALPWLDGLNARTAMTILLLPHAFRHIGLSFLVPGLVADDMPWFFSVTAGYGDLLSAMLAIVALVALQGRWSIALPVIWLFTIVGIADLVNALRQAEAVLYFQSSWYIPTFIVPLLLTTHAMIIARLVKRAPALKTELGTRTRAGQGA
ncbi:MAG: hypothetical protein AAFW97_12085 [Pseudomonadota bacterium]